MKMTTQKQLKESILEYLSDGKRHSISEIKCAVEKKGFVIEKGSSKLRTALYFLKQEDSRLTNPEKGIYKYIITDLANSFSYNLKDFEHVNASPREANKSVVSIFPNGTVAINGILLNQLDNYMAEIKIMPDCSRLALVKKGEGMIRFGKNGRIKNYELVSKISRQKKKLPLYYVGNWDNQGLVWIGDLSDYNPNNGRKKKTTH